MTSNTLIQSACYALNLSLLPEFLSRVISCAIMFQSVFVVSGMLYSLFIEANSDKLKQDPSLGSKYSIYKFKMAVVSQIHAIYAVLFCIPILFEKNLVNDRVFGISQYAMKVYGVSLGPSLQYYGAVFLMFEVSTIFLNNKKFISIAKPFFSPKNITYVSTANDLLFLISFFIVRIVLGPYFSYNVFADLFDAKASVPNWIIGFYFSTNFTLNCLNFFWFYKIINIAAKKLGLSKPSKPAVKSE
ncbi:putative TLC domain-containing protein [Smittium culicis]|uniref:Putative TLC domain-containing protein n=1 Tax=Smittium culicis TaxID=133412 RepID=A0A1R1XYN9_9FUNG|nr:putative TLC domain-containing protein [Smittium culicis]